MIHKLYCLLKNNLLIFNAITLFVILYPAKSFSATQSVTTCINPLAIYDPTHTAHAIASQNVVSACNSFFWLSSSDKEIFSVALTAAINKKRVVVWYDDTAASKSFLGFVSTTCRVRSIHVEFNQPTTPCSGL